MKTAREPCGCRYQTDERERWLELCPKHKAEHDELHARAAAEHRVSLSHHQRDTEKAS